ncbi:hypothetical protein ADUPG1_000234 [Aduncisulcus paluster]|uniref:Uncharacterized protein n=1 Tax=Aduncisulcus paluster TaxID=2918883 RepID=A0ABQ5K954_9EUKA|nr:hypothetical protein ADUPG1_000234 [Aduncisulcus paluster]
MSDFNVDCGGVAMPCLFFTSIVFGTQLFIALLIVWCIGCCNRSSFKQNVDEFVNTVNSVQNEPSESRFKKSLSSMTTEITVADQLFSLNSGSFEYVTNATCSMTSKEMKAVTKKGISEDAMNELYYYKLMKLGSDIDESVQYPVLIDVNMLQGTTSVADWTKAFIRVETDDTSECDSDLYCWGLCQMLYYSHIMNIYVNPESTTSYSVDSIQATNWREVDPLTFGCMYVDSLPISDLSFAIYDSTLPCGIFYRDYHGSFGSTGSGCMTAAIIIGIALLFCVIGVTISLCKTCNPRFKKTKEQREQIEREKIERIMAQIHAQRAEKSAKEAEKERLRKEKEERERFLREQRDIYRKEVKEKKEAEKRRKEEERRQRQQDREAKRGKLSTTPAHSEHLADVSAEQQTFMPLSEFLRLQEADVF